MPEEAIDSMLARFRTLLVRFRADGLDSIDLALDSFENDMGGVLKIQIPCKQRKRTIPEAAFRTERYDEIG